MNHQYSSPKSFPATPIPPRQPPSPPQPLIKVALAQNLSQPSRPTLNFQKLLIFLTPLVILSLAVTLFLHYLSSQKKTLQTAIQNQVNQFNQLSQTYQSIVNLIRQTQEEPANQLLQVHLNLETLTQENVLGLEETPAITQARRLSLLYDQAKDVAVQIQNQNQAIKDQLNSFPLNLYFKKHLSLAEKTEKFTQDTLALLTYLKEINSLEIEMTTYGFEFGVALNESLSHGADEASLKKLEDKLQELDDLKKKFLKIDASGLSADLQKERLEDLQEFEDSQAYFEEIVLSFKSQDPEAILKSLESLLVEAQVATEKGLVETVTFWQENPTLNAAPKLQKDWQDFLNQI